MEGNYIGTNADGNQILINGGNGVEISSFSDFNAIGGTTPEAGNVISGNVDDGVRITISNDNLVEGNYIGTNADGTQILGNSGNGVEISSFSDYNTIGGTTPGARNLISGNVGDGVLDHHSRTTTWWRATTSAPTPTAPRPRQRGQRRRDQQLLGLQHDRRHHARGPQPHFRQRRGRCPDHRPSRTTTWWRATTSAPTPPAPRPSATRATASRSASRCKTRSAAPRPGPATSSRATPTAS